MKENVQALLCWYDVNARVLPWRGIHDPYRTWVSEAMLQQTRVETVLSYYGRFLDRFPDLPSLASAGEEEVLKQWEGLGYYSRARNLRMGAMEVMEKYGGQLPADPALLAGIRGIGPYTAGAIASIAFDLPVPAVDGNVIRVYSRVFGLRENPVLPENRRKIEKLAAELVPEERPGDYNQAVMDLGATICVPGTPDCGRCPLSAFCDAFRAGDAADLPMRPRAKPPKGIPYTVPVILSSGRVLMRQRKEKLLQGLWCFPLLEGTLSEAAIVSRAASRWRLALSGVTGQGNARHVFTHQVWEMSLFTADAPEDAEAPEGYTFVPLSTLGELAVPTAMAAAMKLIPPSA